MLKSYLFTDKEGAKVSASSDNIDQITRIEDGLVVYHKAPILRPPHAALSLLTSLFHRQDVFVPFADSSLHPGWHSVHDEEYKIAVGADTGGAFLVLRSEKKTLLMALILEMDKGEAIVIDRKKLSDTRTEENPHASWIFNTDGVSVAIHIMNLTSGFIKVDIYKDPGPGNPLQLDDGISPNPLL